MDLVFREYSSPFSLLDEIISNGMLNDWIDRFLKSHKESLQWEVWINKIHEQSWADYLAESEANEDLVNASWGDREIEATISDNFEMMQNFKPE